MRQFGDDPSEIPSSDFRAMMRRHRQRHEPKLLEAAAICAGLACAIAAIWWAVTP